MDWKDMKFDMIIMNPPYSKAINSLEKTLEAETEVISLQPARWIQEPLVKSKKSDFEKMRPILEKRLKSVDIVSAKEAQECFNGNGINVDLGIFHIAKNEIKDHFDYDSLSNERAGIDIKNFKRLFKEHNLKIENYSNQKHFVPIVFIAGGHKERGTSDGTTDIMRVYGWIGDGVTYDGNYGNGISLLEATKNNKHKTNGDIKNWPGAVFKTKNEAKNFYDYCKLESFRFFVYISHRDVHVPVGVLPFTNDYKKSWTNEMFYDFFKITKKEQKIIKDWAKNLS